MSTSSHSAPRRRDQRHSGAAPGIGADPAGALAGDGFDAGADLVERCPVQAVGLLTPLSWWVEGVRQALFPGGLTAIGGEGSFFTATVGLPAPAPAQIVLSLLATGTVATLASIAVFRASDRRAKDRGLLDQTTGS